MPQFSGELRERQFPILVARRGLQAAAGRMGSAHPQALEIVNKPVIAGAIKQVCAQETTIRALRP
jgi:hypothetical protein